MTRRRAAVIVTVLLALHVAELCFGLWVDGELQAAGRTDLAGFDGPVLAILIGAVTAAVVGAVVAVNQPRHPVG